MGGEHAFAAEVGMLRGKPTREVGIIGIGGLGHWPLLAAGIGCEVTAFTTTPAGRTHFLGAKFVHHLRIIKIGEFMEGLAVCSAVISLLFLISSSSAFADGQHGFSIKVFTSPDDQFWVNSVIIEGTHAVMLVDAQSTKTNAERVLQEIKETKKPLSIIYITHEHADHFLGLEVFREAYPGVRIIANSSVVDRT